MERLFGTIVDMNFVDALGWIVLEDGRRIRFGASACGKVRPAVGMKVEVLGLRPGFGGHLKAVEVEAASVVSERLVWPPPEEEYESGPDGKVRLVAFDLDGFANAHPWPPPGVLRARACPATDLAPWSASKAPKLRGRVVPAVWRKPMVDSWAPAYSFTEVDGDAYDARFGGSEASLSRPWPECATCRGPQTLVLELKLESVAALSLGEGHLFFFTCFQCGDTELSSPTDMKRCASACIVVETNASKCRPTSPRTRAKSDKSHPRRALRLAPTRSYPSVEDNLVGEVVDGLSAVSFEDSSPTEEYAEALKLNRHRSQVGGFPDWIHNDETPRCSTCGEPMWLLISIGDDAGFDFGDAGSMHLFFCSRTRACPAIGGTWGYIEG